MAPPSEDHFRRLGRLLELEVRSTSFPAMRIFSGSGMEEMDINLKEMMPGLFGGKSKKRSMTVAEAGRKGGQS